MGSTQQYSLKWNKYQRNWDNYLKKVSSNHLFSDVMVACDGQVFQLHRIVLASCSSYFEKTLQTIPAKETPIVMLSEITELEMRTLIEFMYCGEATIDQSQLEALLKAAEQLQIKGLVKSDGDESEVGEDCDEEGSDDEAGSESEPEPEPELAAAERGLLPPLPSVATTPPPPLQSLLPPPLQSLQSPPLQSPPLQSLQSLPPAPGVAGDLGRQSVTPPRPLPVSGECADQLDGPPRVTISRQSAEPASGAGRPPPPLLPYQNGHFFLPSMHESPVFGASKRNTPDSPHVLAALQQISAGQLTVAEASIQYDIPIPTLYVNMRRQGVKARGRVGLAGKRKPRGVMSVEMRDALEEIRAGAITASKASRKYNITLPRLVSWMRKTGVKSAYAKGPQLQESRLVKCEPSISSQSAQVTLLSSAEPAPTGAPLI